MNDFFVLIKRSLLGYLRQPAAIIPSFAISVFFLFVYNAGLGSVANLPGFNGSYLAFIIPVSIASAAISGAGLAGQALIRDIESGYFTKLLLTPTRRLAIIWGPMVAGAVILVAQVLAIMALGLLMGLRSATGVAGLVLVIVYAFLWGLSFAGFTVFFALRTKNSAAAQAATFAFFPLIFLSTTFVPMKYISAGWLKVAAYINPTTYVFAAMRSLLNDGWRVGPLVVGLAVVIAFASITGGLALYQARKATQTT
ncbi:MAG: ABC transporter permease [Thermoleophilia bacterium]